MLFIGTHSVTHPCGGSNGQLTGSNETALLLQWDGRTMRLQCTGQELSVVMGVFVVYWYLFSNSCAVARRGPGYAIASVWYTDGNQYHLISQELDWIPEGPDARSI